MNRNKNLDILKGISVFCVISAHTTFVFMPKYWYGLIRIAVPLFFMISGYYSKDTIKYNLKHIVKSFILLIICELSYVLLFYLYDEYYKFEYLKTQTIKNVLLGNLMIWNHGWFMVSLIYMYIINLVITRFKRKHIMMFIFVALGLFCLYYGAYINHMQSMVLRYTYILTRGIPFFFGAKIIKKYEKKINIPIKAIKCAVPISTAGILLERYLIINEKLRGIDYFNVTTPILIFCLFYIAIKEYNYNMPFLSFVGQHLSMLMYCIHLALIDIAYHMEIEIEAFSLFFLTAAVTYVIYEIKTGLIKIVIKNTDTVNVIDY